MSQTKQIQFKVGDRVRESPENLRKHGYSPSMYLNSGQTYVVERVSLPYLCFTIDGRERHLWYTRFELVHPYEDDPETWI